MSFHIFRDFYQAIPSSEIHVETWRQQVQKVLSEEMQEDKKHATSPPFDLSDVDITYAFYL
jgi:hypothetical protein